MADTHNKMWLGDSAELSKKFHPGSIQCVVTDPPFGVDNQSNMAVTQDGKDYARKIANDESPELAIQVFTNSAMTAASAPKMIVPTISVSFTSL